MAFFNEMKLTEGPNNDDENSHLLCSGKTHQEDQSNVHCCDKMENFQSNARIMRKKDFSIYFSMVILTAFIGYTLTFDYKSDGFGEGNLDLMRTQKFPTMGAKKDHSKRAAQKFADQERAKELNGPVLEAEAFYKSANLNGKSSSTPPPHPPPSGCKATVIVLRHCENGAAREHCGYMGYERSEFLATLFGNSEDARWPVPSFIFATAPNERHKSEVLNWREIETVEPLSKKFNITIDQSFGYPEKQNLVNHIFTLLRTGEMCGKLAVISWKHHDIPHFTHSLGCGPDQGCPMDYDDMDFESAWEILYSFHK